MDMHVTVSEQLIARTGKFSPKERFMPEIIWIIPFVWILPKIPSVHLIANGTKNGPKIIFSNQSLNPTDFTSSSPFLFLWPLLPQVGLWQYYG